MAGIRDMADVPLTEVSDGREHGGNDISAHVQVPDSQYHEAISSHIVPTKTGDEEAIDETQYDDERPRTAGTTTSGTTDFDNTEDGALLASLTVRPRKPLEDSAFALSPPHEVGSFFARPASPDGIAPDMEFSFTKANHKPLDFTGKRKGPFAIIAAANPESAIHQPKSVNNQPQETTTVPDEDCRAVVGPNQDDRRPSLMQPAVDVKGKKYKKKKRRQHGTVPTELPEQYTPVTEPGEDATAHASIENFDGVHHGQPIIAVDAHDTAHENLDLPRACTPIVHHGSEQLEAGASSPHSQLQNDLQVAASEHDQYTRGTHAEQTFRSDQAQPEAPEVEPTSQARAYQYLPEPQLDGRTPTTKQATHSRGNTNCHNTSRVTKRKSKAGRGATAPAPADVLQSDQDSSDVNDYMQILAYKVQQKRQLSASKLAAKRQAMDAELRQIVEAKLALQDELDAVQQQKSSLTIVVEQQRTKVAAYESKLSRFKTFVDGLGNDVDALKKEAGTTRRKGEHLAQESEDRKAEQSRLNEQLSICAERSAQLKNQALQACQDAQADLRAANMQKDYLSQQLGEKVGLLAEERDRRSQLERQLAAAASSDEAVLRALRSNNDAVLDKLYEIHAVIEHVEDGKKMTEMMEKALAAVQALTSQHSANADSLTSVTGMIEALSESLNGFSKAADSTSDGERSDLAAIQAHLDDTLRGLRADISQREDLLRQDATHREAIRGLQDKLEESNKRAAETLAQLSTTQARESQQKEENTSLQAKITALQKKSSPTENTHVQLCEVKAELELKTKALESARTGLSEKAEELRNLTTTNAKLQDQMRTLQQRLEEVQSQVVDFEPERAELERKFKAQLEKMQKELASHSRQTYINDKMVNDNKLLQMTSARDGLQKQVQPLKEELAATKTKLAELQRRSSTSTRDTGLKLQEKDALIQAKQHEIETLQTSVQKLEGQLKGDVSLKNQYDALSTRHNELVMKSSAEKTKYKQLAEAKALVTKQAEEAQHALERAQSAEEEARAELERTRAESSTALESLDNQLVEAKVAADHAETGLQLLEQSCKDAIEKAESRCKKSIEALQQSLGQKERELAKHETDSEEFRVKIDEAWRLEQQENRKRSDQAKSEIAEAHSRRDEALAENLRLRNELADRANKQADALRLQLEQLEQRQAQQQRSSKGPDVPASRLRVPLLQDDVTPAASSEENEPPKLRKKVERNANVIVETAPVPVPEVLRRPESRTRENGRSTAKARGPVVEESQPRDVTPAPLVGIGHDLKRASPPPSHSAAFFETFSGSEDMLDVVSTRSNRLPRTVEESQSDDKLPSFAAFNNSIASSHAARPRPLSSVFSVPLLRGRASQPRTIQHSTKSEELRKDIDTAAGYSAFDKFVIYEDSEQLADSLGTHHPAARPKLQDNPSLSQMDRENNYTFRKTFPNPNSASRMVHREGGQGHGTNRPRSDMSNAATSRGETVRTPSVRSEGRDSTPKGMRPPIATQKQNPAGHSSSPDFVHPTASGRKTNTYYTTPGGSGSAKRRVSRTDSGATADPRLARREAPAAQKRKAEGYIVQRYEHERKKRLSKGSTADLDPAQVSRYALRASTHQPSINDLPSMPNVSGRKGSSHVSRGGPKSLIRTLAGGSSRTAQGSRKLPNTDEINARFAQELSR